MCPGAIPIFTNLDDTVTVPNTQAGGSVLFTLAFSDNDLEDAGQLTLTQTGTTGSASTYFELNTITCKYFIYCVFNVWRIFFCQSLKDLHDSLRWLHCYVVVSIETR